MTRREKVWVVAQDRHGKKIKVAGSGLLGRALQHELDHLDGKLYIDYLDSMDELMAVGAGRRGRRGGPRGDERPGVTDGRAGGSRVRTVFLGSGGFGVPSAPTPGRRTPAIELVGVVTAPPRPAGRGRAPRRRRSTTRRRELGLAPILTPDRLRAPEAVAAVLGAATRRSLVLADYGQIVPAPLLELPHGALNLHPSLLPRHRGATPIPATILAGDAETGRHADADGRGPRHRADRRAGSGSPLDGTRRRPSSRRGWPTSAADLLERHRSVRGSRGELAGDAAAGRRRDADPAAPARGRPARPGAAGRRARAPGPRLPAVARDRSSRPTPGGSSSARAERRRRARATTPAGTFGRDAGSATADGALALHEVQPAGGRPMPWAAYLRGRPGDRRLARRAGRMSRLR